MRSIDVNCDMGESFGVYVLGNDDAIVRHVTSVSVACGFHAGDPSVMRKTIALAREHGVSVGAHPGLPDLMGFGRRFIRLTPKEAEDLVIYQVGAALGVATAESVRIDHVKMHGQLSDMALHDDVLAAALANALARVAPELILISRSGGRLARAAESAGLRVANEVFADRGYMADGTGVPRRNPGALITNPEAAADQVEQMIKDGTVTAVDGTKIEVKPDTVCIHGDTAGAVAIAEAVRRRLERIGCEVRPLRDWIA